MARLTTFSRLLITLAIVAGIFYAVKTFFPELGKRGAADTPAVVGNTEAGTPETTPAAPVRTFGFTAPEPINGKLKGVVELGATGFNSFIVRIDLRKNWKLEKAEYGASLVYESLTSDDDVKSGLKRYIADMIGYGVGAKDIHFVISSGAKKVAVTETISRELKKMGYYVNEVTPQQEARYALLSCLPRQYNNQAFVVDIGSGNTKISWMPDGALEGPGSKYYQKNLSDNQVYQEITALTQQIPSRLRNTCFIIGGVPYELAKQVRQDKERYSVLKAASAYQAEGEKQRSGLNIYKAIADATGCNEFVFDWDANFTIGFLLTLP